MKKSVLFLFASLQFCLIDTTIAQEEHVVDSLNKALAASQEDTSKVNTLIELATEYRRVDMEKSIAYSASAIDLAKTLEFEEGEAMAFYYSGIASALGQEFQAGIDFHEKALEKFTALHNREKQADCLRKIGSLYLYLGSYTKSVEYLLEAIPIFKSLNDTVRLAGSYNNIAIAFFNTMNIEKAEEYLIKTADLYEILGNEEDLFAAYNGLGNICDSKEDYKGALEYYLKCLEIAEKLGVDPMKSTSYGSLGLVSYSMKNYPKSIAYLKESISISKRINDDYELTNGYTNLASSYIQIKEWSKALSSLDSALKYSSEETYLTYGEPLFFNYSVIYEELGFYKKALESRKEYNSIRDSIYSIENAEIINELNVKFETEKNEKEIIKLESEKKANELELLKSSAQQNRVIAIATFLLLILVFSFLYWRQKQINSKKTIALNKEKIASLSKENKIQYANALIEGQETERKRLAQDLHDRLGSVLSTMKLHLSSSKNVDIEKVQWLLDKSVEEVRTISHNLASLSLVKFGLTASIKSLSESNSSHDFQIVFTHHGMDEQLSPQIAIALYRCVQELISNVIKHAKASKVSIQLQQNEEEINLIVEDNGVGFDTKSEFSGIGLKNIKARIDAIKGTIEIDSSLKKGTSVLILASIKHD